MGDWPVVLNTIDVRDWIFAACILKWKCHVWRGWDWGYGGGSSVNSTCMW